MGSRVFMNQIFSFYAVKSVSVRLGFYLPQTILLSRPHYYFTPSSLLWPCVVPSVTLSDRLRHRPQTPLNITQIHFSDWIVSPLSVSGIHKSDDMQIVPFDAGLRF